MKLLQPILVYCLLTFSLLSNAQNFTRVNYGPEERQFMDIYLAQSDCLTPVYFDAHGNGGNTNIPNSLVNDLMAEGISIVSWESLTSVNTPEQVETGWEDAELLFAWVIENASIYNFDTTNFIIGGSSRGSILSWKYGHRPNPNIRGLYMYNALPDGAWRDPDWWYPPDEVNLSSPPIFFVYRPEPGVIGDTHDPENGLIIMEKYDELGIGDRDTMIHSIGFTDNTDRYQFLAEFARSVIEPCQRVTSSSEAPISPKLKVFPNPFQNRFEISGLKGEEHFILYSFNGTQVREFNNLDLLRMEDLSPGLYFLTVRTKENSHVFKLVKN